MCSVQSTRCPLYIAVDLGPIERFFFHMDPLTDLRLARIGPSIGPPLAKGQPFFGRGWVKKNFAATMCGVQDVSARVPSPGEVSGLD